MLGDAGQRIADSGSVWVVAYGHVCWVGYVCSINGCQRGCADSHSHVYQFVLHLGDSYLVTSDRHVQCFSGVAVGWGDFYSLDTAELARNWD